MFSKFGPYISSIFALFLLFALGNIFFFYYNLRSINNNENWVQHTLIVKSALANTLQAVTDAETGERGYLISEDKNFLVPYNQALPQIKQDIESVQSLTIDNPLQQKRIPLLKKLANTRIAYLKKGITLEDQKGLTASQAFTLVNQGRKIMNQLRDVIVIMQSEEDTLLQQRETSTERNYSIVYITSLIIGFLNIIFIILAFYLLRQELDKRNEIKMALEAREKRFRALIENGYEGFALIKVSGEITYVSPSVKKILGFTSNEYIKFDRFDRLRPEDAEKMKNIYATLKPNKIITTTLLFKHKSNKWIWIENISSNKINDPNIKAIVVNFRDVTERMEEEKRKDEFISMASHELKTPITVMKMFLDILQNQISIYRDKKAEKYLSTLKGQTNKLRELTADLLDISRIQTGKLTFHQENFLVEKIVKEALEELRPTMERHMLVYKKGSDMKVYIDRFRIFQVLTNLITNAAKYSPNARRIIVTVEKANNQAIVSVKDYGIGINKSQQEKIFEKLYQVTDTKEKTFPGLGMGLFISQEIIQRHGGRIWVESKKGKGSTFYFSLPIVVQKL